MAAEASVSAQFAVSSPNGLPIREESNQDIIAVDRVLCMQGGDGDDSYARNSSVQNYTFQAFVKPNLAEAIEFLHLPTDGLFRIADLGCSHGRNTLDYADFIVGKLEERYRSAAVPFPEIQYYFSDLPANDFNNLFRSLPTLMAPPQEGAVLEEDEVKDTRSYYAAGVPGSFHRRLFPKGSINFGLSAYSLQWISQIPAAVLNRESPAWNGGHIWIHGERPAVADAYAQQFQHDIRNFLRCRAEELISGAILFLLILGRAQEHPPGTYMAHYDLWTLYMEPTWDEMVSEGLVDAEVRDMFNVPQYMPCSAELEGVLKDFEEFDVLKVKTLEGVPNLPQEELEKLLSDPEAFGKFMGGLVRSLSKSLVEAHLGAELSVEFFKRLERIAREGAHLAHNLAYDFVLVVLVRQ